jgi:hypothetical protein
MTWWSYIGGSICELYRRLEHSIEAPLKIDRLRLADLVPALTRFDQSPLIVPGYVAALVYS